MYLSESQAMERANVGCDAEFGIAPDPHGDESDTSSLTEHNRPSDWQCWLRWNTLGPLLRILRVTEMGGDTVSCRAVEAR